MNEGTSARLDSLTYIFAFIVDVLYALFIVERIEIRTSDSASS